MNVRGFIEPQHAVDLIFLGQIDFKEFKELFYDRGEHNYQKTRSVYIEKLTKKLYEISGGKFNYYYNWLLKAPDPIGNKDYPMYDGRGLYVYDAQGKTGKEDFMSRFEKEFEKRGVKVDFFDKDYNFRSPNYAPNPDFRPKITYVKQYLFDYNKEGPITEIPTVAVVRDCDPDYRARVILKVPLSSHYFGSNPPKKSLLNFEFDPTLKIGASGIIDVLFNNQVSYEGFEHHIIGRGLEYSKRYLAFNIKAVEFANQKNLDDPSKLIPYEKVFDQNMQFEVGIGTIRNLVKQYESALMFKHNKNFYNSAERVFDEIYGDKKNQNRLKKEQVEEINELEKANKVYGENHGKRMEKYGFKGFSKKGKEKLDEID